MHTQYTYNIIIVLVGQPYQKIWQQRVVLIDSLLHTRTCKSCGTSVAKPGDGRDNYLRCGNCFGN